MKRHLIVIVCLLTWFCSTHAADGAELRTWTSKSGKFTVKAELLSFAEGVVNLQRADGKKIKVPLAKLSKKDQNYVVARRRPKIDPVKAPEKLGAKIKRNEQGDVVGVYLQNTPITDAGLVHLAGLTNLQTLSLRDTPVTDAGLVHLAGLTNLEHLNLDNTQITDAGLVHLAGLTNLEVLQLIGTQVTDGGVAELQKSLLNCRISH